MTDFEFVYFDEDAGLIRKILIPAKSIWDAIALVQSAYPNFRKSLLVNAIKEL